MPKNPILITGCQRSGTTLLNLILNSHPEIKAIDEVDFDKTRFQEYLNDETGSHSNVAFKLPMRAHIVKRFGQLPNAKTIWCIRDPRDVVVSMLNLTVTVKGYDPYPWTDHMLGAHPEIVRTMGFLIESGYRDSESYYKTYGEFCNKPAAERSREDSVFTAALCWRLKNELLEIFEKEDISLYISRYEDLVTAPKDSIGKILEFLDLPWHENVLLHHRLHDGTSIGNTDNRRRIDAASVGTWRSSLDEQDLSIVVSLCANIARKYGYQLSE